MSSDPALPGSSPAFQAREQLVAGETRARIGSRGSGKTGERVGVGTTFMQRPVLVMLWHNGPAGAKAKQDIHRLNPSLRRSKTLTRPVTQQLQLNLNSNKHPQRAVGDSDGGGVPVGVHHLPLRQQDRLQPRGQGRQELPGAVRARLQQLLRRRRHGHHQQHHLRGLPGVVWRPGGVHRGGMGQLLRNQHLLAQERVGRAQLEWELVCCRPD